MEDSHVPLNKWVYAFREFMASKNGVSAHQLHRTIGVSYKTAWFLGHRIREALRQGGLAPPVMGGGQLKVVADETFIGHKPHVTQKARIQTQACRADANSLIACATGTSLLAGKVACMKDATAAKSASILISMAPWPAEYASLLCFRLIICVHSSHSSALREAYGCGLS
jgi:hypothetical protein